jgi:hypothetical protein
MTVEKLYIISKIVLVFTLAVVLAVTPIIVNRQLTALRNDATIQINSFRTDTEKLVNMRADSLQSTVTGLFDKTNARVDSIETKTFDLASDIRKDTFLLADNVRQDSFTQIAALNDHLDSQMTALNNHVDSQFGVFNGSVMKVTDAYAGIPARFDRQTDCDHNALCWQNLTTDTLTNFRFTGRDISASTKVFNDGFPVLMTGFQTSVTNFASITTNINRLTTPKWYDRLLGYGLNGVIIYRNLNPATNVVIKGTQFLTAH